MRTKALISIGAAAIVIGIQFIRPGLSTSAGGAGIDVPAPVKQILRTSCYNCHSNETQLSWFDQIVPAYWIVADDVKKARAHLNFSEIGELPATQPHGILYEAVNQIQSGDMPPSNYLLLHREAKIGSGQLAVLKEFLNPYGQGKTADSSQGAAADAAYEKWRNAGVSTTAVQPAPNGIAFFPEYRDWKAISSTERFDNQAITLVLGNPVAIEAVEKGHFNPWPDGTILAKVAWDRLIDDNGAVRTGSFKQVEFMIKDSRKYRATLGWGFARWRGVDLQPFGKDAGFASGCVSCHKPMRNNDFVFTRPIRGHQ